MLSRQRRLVFAIPRCQVDYPNVGRQASLPDRERVVFDDNETGRQTGFGQAAVNKMHGALSVYVTRLTGDPFTGTTLQGFWPIRTAASTAASCVGARHAGDT